MAVAAEQYTSDITNNSSQTVEAIDGYVESEESARVGYEQDLTLLAFTDSVGDSTSITLASKKSAKLVRTRATATVMYSVKDGYFTPVYQKGITYDDLEEESSNTVIPGDETDSEGNVIVPGAFTRMQSAIQFCQNISANPTSTLADSFEAALNSAPTDQDTYMTDWFSQHSPYEYVKWSNYYIPASSWMNKFASLWVMKNDLYDGDDLPAAYYVYTSSSSYCTPLGKIVVTPNQDATENDLDDTGVGYIFTYKPDSGDDIELTFSWGALTDSSGDISLGAGWDYKGSFTTDASDQSTMWPIFAGSIYGTSVVAIPMTPVDEENAPVSFWETEGFQKYFSLVMGIFMVAMAFEFVSMKGYLVYKKINNYKAKYNKDPSAEEKTQMEEEAQAEANATNAENESRIRKIANDDSLKLPTDEAELGDLRTTVKGSAVTNLEWQSKARAKFSYDSTESTLKNLADIQNNESITEASNSLSEAADYYKAGDYGNCSTKIVEANGHLDTAIDSMAGSIDEQAEKLYKSQVEYNTSSSEQAKEYSDDLEKAKSGETEDVGADPYLPEYIEVV